jgi:hypothetical protein
LPDSQLVVQAQPALPTFFLAGLVVNLFYLVISNLFGYYMFKRSMFPPAESPGGYEEVDIHAGYGSVVFIDAEKDDLGDRVINVFSGYPRGFNGKITVCDQDMVNSLKKEFVFVPRQLKVPGHFRTGFLINCLGKMPGIPLEKIGGLKQDKKDLLKKRFSDLAPGERAILLLDLCQLKRAKIYILRNPGIPGKSLNGFVKKLRLLKESGALILCLAEIFMRPDKSYKYEFDQASKRYEDLDNYGKSINFLGNISGTD